MNRLQLKDWRRARWLTQPQLATLLGINVMTVWRWEHGETDMPAFLDLALLGLDTQHRWSKAGIDALPRIGKRASA